MKTRNGIQLVARLLVFVIITGWTARIMAADDLAWIESYHLTWTSQSKNSGDSMPCGGHDVGLNVWVEKGDLLFYIAKSGANDENNSLLKLVACGCD